MSDTSINQTPIDVYTLAHAGWGALAFKAGLGLPVVVAASLAFEYWLEPTLKRRRPDVFPWPSQDSTANSVCDTLAVIAGWGAASKAGSAAVPVAIAAVLVPVIVDPQIRKLLVFE